MYIRNLVIHTHTNVKLVKGVNLSENTCHEFRMMTQLLLRVRCTFLLSLSQQPCARQRDSPCQNFLCLSPHSPSDSLLLAEFQANTFFLHNILSRVFLKTLKTFLWVYNKNFYDLFSWKRYYKYIGQWKKWKVVSCSVVKTIKKSSFCSI